MIADLPDSHPAYIDGIGPVTIGELRDALSAPGDDENPELEATFRMWEDRVTRNLCTGRPWERGGTPAARKPSTG